MPDELIDSERLAEIRAALALVPAPPWHWRGDTYSGPFLATVQGGWRLVMGFRRLGMQGAQPAFPAATPNGVFVYEAKRQMVPRTDYDTKTFCDIDNPVARWMRDSAQFVAELLADRNALARELADSRDRTLAAKQEAQKAQDLADSRYEEWEKTQAALDRLHMRILRDLPGDASEVPQPDDPYWARVLDDLVGFAGDVVRSVEVNPVEG